MAKGRPGFYSAGGPSNGGGEAWEPRIDKNPFYRTMDIFNGVFKKQIKLVAGDSNRTDLKTICVNFDELKPALIEEVLRPGRDAQRSIYRLACGHEWEGKTHTKDGKPKQVGVDWGMCSICGADQIYLGFEHEWQHIIFKSDLVARKIFCEQYATQLVIQYPGVDHKQLTQFLATLVNAFDDLRVNSLWEKVYPGSASAIIDRWRWYTLRSGNAVNESFMSFVFAVAFGLPTNPQGELEALRPIVQWGVDKVKYRGHANMLIEVRVVLDRCMGTLLAKIPPPPPKGMQPPPPPSHQPLPPEGQGHGPNPPPSVPPDPAPPQPGSGQSQPDTPPPEEGGSGEAEEGEGGETEAPPEQAAPGDVASRPSAKDVPATEQEKKQALERLMKDPVDLDPKEEHPEPTDEELKTGQNSQSMRALMSKVLNHDIDDLDKLDQLMPTDEVDEEMEEQLEQLNNGITTRSGDSVLTNNAKANIQIIDVTRQGVGDSLVKLDDEERFYVQRMRSAFYRTMGKQKAKRGPDGTQVDVQALIQYRGDHQDPNVFENEEVNQGFAYSVLCDMSGSMSGVFGTVCHAVQMLKEALHFPFVIGNLWGFRGAGNRSANYGGVWMYKYARDVDWYTGQVSSKTGPVRVECGGITPMNSAINVASGHLWRRMPTGVAKRMFILTDGAPMHVRVTGAQISEFVLRKFVTKEIQDARKHGIEVYTIVIGEHAIDEAKCLQMFGPRKFWRRVGQERVGTVLASLVLANFQKYIRTRG